MTKKELLEVLTKKADEVVKDDDDLGTDELEQLSTAFEEVIDEAIDDISENEGDADDSDED